MLRRKPHRLIAALLAASAAFACTARDPLTSDQAPGRRATPAPSPTRQENRGDAAQAVRLRAQITRVESRIAELDAKSRDLRRSADSPAQQARETDLAEAQRAQGELIRGLQAEIAAQQSTHRLEASNEQIHSKQQDDLWNRRLSDLKDRVREQERHVQEMERSARTSFAPAFTDEAIKNQEIVLREKQALQALERQYGALLAERSAEVQSGHRDRSERIRQEQAGSIDRQFQLDQARSDLEELGKQLEQSRRGSTETKARIEAIESERKELSVELDGAKRALEATGNAR